jgi:hypothetical protein
VTQNRETQEDLVDVVHPIEAQKWLGVSAATYKALARSGLLGRITDDGQVFWEDLQHYDRFGTQWRTADRPGVTQRMVTADMLQSIPPPPDMGEHDQPGAHMTMYLWPEGTEQSSVDETVDLDTGWLAHLYLIPNPYMWPTPASMGMIGTTLLKLRRKRTVLNARLRTELYPDPWGSLALVTVFQPNGSPRDSFDDAMDVAGPVLDELSAKYDQPLPVSHTAVISIPSGVMMTFSSKLPKIRILEPGDRLYPRCPYPELKHAVSLYREGVSSNSPFHQFLTLWKVYENACEVRGKWQKQHKRRPVKVEDETIPDAFAFGGYQGRTFDEVRQELNDPFRVALAHGGNIRGGGAPKTAASAEDLLSVTYAVPVVRHMSYVTLRNVRATLDSTAGSKRS